MRTLDIPISIKTRFGILQATYEAHSFHVVDEPNNARIVSDKTLGLADADGVLVLLPETRSSVDIGGADRDALGTGFTTQDVSAKHAEILLRTTAAAAAATAVQEAALQAQISAASAQLKTLQAQVA